MALEPCGTLATAISFSRTSKGALMLKHLTKGYMCAYNDQTVNFKDELKAEPSHIVFKLIVLLLKNCILLFRVKFDDLLH